MCGVVEVDGFQLGEDLQGGEGGREGGDEHPWSRRLRMQNRKETKEGGREGGRNIPFPGRPAASRFQRALH